MTWHDGKSIAEIVHEFGAVRGDLSDQYARDQLVSIIEGRIRAGCVETERQVRAAVLDALGDDPAQATEERVYAEGAYHAMWSFFLRLPHSPMSDAVQREAMRLRAALDPETGP